MIKRHLQLNLLNASIRYEAELLKAMICRTGFNYYKTIESELENFDTLGLSKPGFSCLELLNLQIWEPESLYKGPSLMPTKTTGNPTWTAKDEYVLFSAHSGVCGALQKILSPDHTGGRGRGRIFFSPRPVPHF